MLEGWAHDGACVCELLSQVHLSATAQTVTYQAPLSVGCPRQEYWNGRPFPSHGLFLTQGSNLGLPHLRRLHYGLSQSCWLIFRGIWTWWDWDLPVPCRETELECVGPFPYMEAPVIDQGPLDLQSLIYLPPALWPSCHLPSPRSWSLGPSLRIPFQVSQPPSEGCLGKTAKSKGSFLEDLGVARALHGFVQWRPFGEPKPLAL